MEIANEADFRLELKRLIVDATDQDLAVAELGDGDALFGPRSPLDLDSIDALQISMALQTRYGIVVTDPKQVRKILRSVNTLVDFLRDATPRS